MAGAWNPAASSTTNCAKVSRPWSAPATVAALRRAPPGVTSSRYDSSSPSTGPSAPRPEGTPAHSTRTVARLASDDLAASMGMPVCRDTRAANRLRADSRRRSVYPVAATLKLASMASLPGRVSTLKGRGISAGAAAAAAERSVRRSGRSILLFREIVAGQAANPDVAEADTIMVFLQHERLLGIVRRVLRHLPVDHGADRFLVVVNQHAIEEHGLNGRLDEPLAFKPRRFEDDVVDLPLTRFASRIHKRRELPVNRRCLAVGVGGIVEGVEHLNLVTAHQQHAAIAARLAGTFDVGQLGPLDVKLAVAELLTREKVTRAGSHLEVAAPDFPLRVHDLVAIGALAVLRPLGEVFAVEQHDGVRRRRGPAFSRRRPP